MKPYNLINSKICKFPLYHTWKTIQRKILNLSSDKTYKIFNNVEDDIEDDVSFDVEICVRDSITEKIKNEQRPD